MTRKDLSALRNYEPGYYLFSPIQMAQVLGTDARVKPLANTIFRHDLPYEDQWIEATVQNVIDLLPSQVLPITIHPELLYVVVLKIVWIEGMPP